MKLTVEIKGTDELIGKMNRLNQLMAVGVEREVRKAATAIRKSAKVRVPVRTGLLKRSIKTKYSKDKLSAAIGPQGKGSWKGHFVEFGTRKMAAKPFMAPAYEENKEAFLNGMSDALKGAVKES